MSLFLYAGNHGRQKIQLAAYPEFRNVPDMATNFPVRINFHHTLYILSSGNVHDMSNFVHIYTYIATHARIIHEPILAYI